MIRDAFTDKYEPAEAAVNGGVQYVWPVSHEDEDPQEKVQNVDRTATTSGVGFVRQQGAPVPTIFKLKGWILTKEQLEKMEAFYNACAGIGTPSRTIWHRDIEGVEREVLIVSFKPQRVPGISRDGLFFVWKYEIELEVV